MSISNRKDLIFKQVIRNLKNAGIEDITTEVCTLKINGKTTKFKFYKPENWKVLENKATPAQVIAGVATEGYINPHIIVNYKENDVQETYFVRIIPLK